MAIEIEMTEAQKRWRDVMRLYHDIIDENGRKDLTWAQIYTTIGKKMRISPSTVRGIINRELAKAREEA